MFAPESDWTVDPPAGMDRFRIDRRISTHGVDLHIRHFRWLTPVQGPMSPRCHYLDFSLGSRARRSRIRSDHWSGAQHTGDMMYLAPNHTYIGEAVRDQRHVLCIGFSQSFLDQVFQDEGRAPEMRPCVDIQNPSLRRMLTSLAGEVAAPGFASDAYVQSIMIALAVELARNFDAARPRIRTPSGLSAQQMRIATDYIADRLDKDLSIAGIARECGVSPRHLTRIFKTETGMTLGEYVATSRIAMAKDLLRSSAKQIKEIGWRCGFQSPSAFSAAFRSATGVTPGGFRDSSPPMH